MNNISTVVHVKMNLMLFYTIKSLHLLRLYIRDVSFLQPPPPLPLSLRTEGVLLQKFNLQLEKQMLLTYFDASLETVSFSFFHSLIMCIHNLFNFLEIMKNINIWSFQEALIAILFSLRRGFLISQEFPWAYTGFS